MSEINSQKEWRTAVTSNQDGKILIRGYNLDNLIGNKSYAEVCFLLLKGEMPTINEAKMLDAIFVSCIDAGIATPSSVAARTVFSGGNSLNAAVAGGILTLGDAHGGAIEKSAKMFQDYIKGKEGIKDEDIKETAKNMVDDALKNKKRLPGYGHKLHTIDPRTKRLLEVAGDLNFGGSYVNLAVAIADEFKVKKPERKLPLNVDGCIAAIISDMGFDYRLGKGFFIIARSCGLVGQVFEEWMREKPFRRLAPDLHEYDGMPERG
ncbi:citryl-CoA lyase [Candidatus Acidulodesulfobacterium sp. H_13]|uniref:citryl-CoA lyase n=1 Tax=Candidatus Acidulodesulfobacterium sp. H_13 TaxID=3395470 RepID=UPI003AF7231F